MSDLSLDYADIDPQGHSPEQDNLAPRQSKPLCFVHACLEIEPLCFNEDCHCGDNAVVSGYIPTEDRWTTESHDLGHDALLSSGFLF